MPEPKAQKPVKGRPVRQIVGGYTKDDNTVSPRHLLTADTLEAPMFVQALDVSTKTPPEVAVIADAYKGYQLALAEHMRQFPTVADWMKQRGLTVETKSFKIAGLVKNSPAVTEL